MKKIRVLHIKRRIFSDGVTMMIYNLAKASKEEAVIDCLVSDLAGSDWAYKFEDLGGAVHCIPNRGANPITRRIHKFQDYVSFFRKQQYDVIHVDTDSLLQIDVPFAAKVAGVKCRVMHSHSSNWEDSHSKILADLLRFFMGANATDFIACSTEAARWLYPKKIQNRVVILKNGIDTKRFTFNQCVREKIRSQYGLHQEFVVGNVGRFVEVKNHTFLLRTFQALQEQYPESKLMLIGEGPLEQDIREQCTSLGIMEDVIFVGAVNNVNEYLNAMDVFVLPSLFEGLPVSLIEAQANGLKCVTSNNVSQEAKVTPNFESLDLNVDLKYWIDSIADAQRITYEEREAAVKAVVDSGYDIATSTRVLMNLYYNRIDKENVK